MPIDEDIAGILELEENEKLVHKLYRAYLSVVFGVIFGVLFTFGIIIFYVFTYLTQFLFDFLLIYLPIILVIMIILIVIGVIIGKWYAAGHLYLITNKRIIFYTKFVNKTMREVRFSKITDSQFKQSPFGRIFNYADIILSTPGMEGIEAGGIGTFFFAIKGINDGLKIRDSIMQLIENAEENE
ncbi:MAG: PH domain-containing protein [Candidatus Helarchaeota archaeon]